MPFEKFKAKHGGRGPFEEAYAAVTGGEGLFGRLGMRDERELTDQLIADVSGNAEFAGLAGVASAGRSPMTREQHAAFRSSLLQNALNTRVINAGYEDYVANSAKLRASLQSRADLEQLDSFDIQAKHAQRLATSGDESLRQQGLALMGNVLAAQREFLKLNEQQALEVQSSEDAQRETIRKEFQSELNARIFDPVRQDTSNYRAIRAQLEGEGAEVAPASLVTAVLEYAGATLQRSGEGDWTFSLGPIGYSDAALPQMTYSQLRNRLDSAYKGRDEYMRGEAARFAEEAKKRGFGINGTRVSDLLFPLADALYAEREAETAPAVGEDAAQSTAAAAAEKTSDVLSGVGRGAFPNLVRYGTDALEYLFGPDEPPPALPRMRTGGGFGGGRTSVSGVIRRPTND